MWASTWFSYLKVQSAESKGVFMKKVLGMRKNSIEMGEIDPCKTLEDKECLCFCAFLCSTLAYLVSRGGGENNQGIGNGLI